VIVSDRGILLIRAICFGVLLTLPHSSSLFFTLPHSSSLLFTVLHCSSLFFTRSSLFFTRSSLVLHSSSLFFTPLHSSSLLCTGADHCACQSGLGRGGSRASEPGRRKAAEEEEEGHATEHLRPTGRTSFGGRLHVKVESNLPQFNTVYTVYCTNIAFCSLQGWRRRR
jgi:hypothetical protein